MKKFTVLILILLSFLSGYLSAHVYPYSRWVSTFSTLDKVEGIEWLKLGGQLLAAAATFTAIVAGLFRERYVDGDIIPRSQFVPRTRNT